MPFTGNIASIMTKKSWSDLGKLLREMQAEINALRTARTLENAYVGRGGITIGDAGSITVQDTDGHIVAQIGALPDAYNRADGSRQPGLALWREDGSLAALLGDLNPATPPYKQALQFTDRVGHVIVSDDTNSGEGVALPYLAFGCPVSNSVPTDTTTAATFTTLASASGYWMSPRYVGSILIHSSDAATTGQARITDENGTQVGSTITVAGNAFAWVNWGPVVLPGGFGDSKILNFQARRTAGTGTIGLRASEPIGIQS